MAELDLVAKRALSEVVAAGLSTVAAAAQPFSRVASLVHSTGSRHVDFSIGGSRPRAQSQQLVVCTGLGCSVAGGTSHRLGIEPVSPAFGRWILSH